MGRRQCWCIRSQNANSVAVKQCGVDDSEGELEDNQKLQSMSMIIHAMLKKIPRTTLASFLTWTVMK
jgi:hypothetical protein